MRLFSRDLRQVVQTESKKKKYFDKLEFDKQGRYLVMYHKEAQRYY